jgi:hypothetical protein
MARSRDGRKRKERSRLIIAIPLVALVIVAGVYVVSILPANSSAPVNFNDEILIEVQKLSDSSSLLVVAPNRTIGEPGGLWATHQYDSYGVAGNYPIYMDLPNLACPAQHACIIHVKSSVEHQYTLGDFMAMWGYPVVSRNNTLGRTNTANYASYVWELCVGATASTAVINYQWGSMLLQPNMAITLEFYNPATGYGCAAS